MEPERATVDVWVVPLDVPDPLRARLIASASPAEKVRAGHFRYGVGARQFLVAHGWLRHILGAALAVPPSEVSLTEGRGKPRLTTGTGLSFNLSHAGELALVAVSGREVGVDVEPLDRAGIVESARVACTPSEAAALERVPADRQDEAFLRLWTAKEAYLKGRGLGLTVEPNWVEVGIDAGTLAPVRLVGEAGATGWWVRELRPAAGYVAAVAAEGPDWALSLRNTEDLGPPLGSPWRVTWRP